MVVGGDVMVKFIIRRLKNAKYYFALMDKCCLIMLSEVYNSKDACENGIKSVQTNAPIAIIDDQTEE